MSDVLKLLKLVKVGASSLVHFLDETTEAGWWGGMAAYSYI
jgi:hypothetical protein